MFCSVTPPNPHLSIKTANELVIFVESSQNKKIKKRAVEQTHIHSLLAAW